MRLTDNSKLVMIGDSITDAGRKQPVGEGSGDALGHGYVALTDALLTARHPELGVRVVNMGTGGHTVRDLAARWRRDVLALTPDWLSVMIGTNDVWRQFDSPDRPEAGVPPDKFARALEALVTQTLPALSGGLVLMTPFYVQKDITDPMRARMDEYGSLVREIAARHGTLFVDTQAAFDAALAQLGFAVLAPDRVHPSLPGHIILARALLEALEFEW